MMETFTQPKITGYRQLNEAEAELMNEIKAHGIATDQLVQKVGAYLNEQAFAAFMNPSPLDSDAASSSRIEARERLQIAVPMRWVSIAKTDMQTGLMALTRAVAQPTSF